MISVVFVPRFSLCRPSGAVWLVAVHFQLQRMIPVSSLVKTLSACTHKARVQRRCEGLDACRAQALVAASSAVRDLGRRLSWILLLLLPQLQQQREPVAVPSRSFAALQSLQKAL